MQFKTTSHAGLALIAGLVLSTPAAHAEGRPPAPMANSAAWFVNWHQGFEHGTDGWYDASISGLLGWCGSISQVTPDNRGQADLKPSAGRSFAKVATGPCNAFWGDPEPPQMGIPFGAPYAPGTELALYSESWPRAGYVTELDIYLDPAWSGQGYANNFFYLPGEVPEREPAETIIQYGVTVFPLDYEPGTIHTGPHYFVDVDANVSSGTLTVAGHEISEAGWYTFRFQLSDKAGYVHVGFELDDPRGGTLARIESIDPVDLLGPFKVPFPFPPLHESPPELLTSVYGSGHAWFRDIAFGLQLPIDEHRVRRGR